MKHLLIFGAAMTSIAAMPALAQTQLPENPAPPTVYQANPPGPGIPTMTPPDPATADQTVAPAMPADQGYHAGPYKGALTAPPAGAMNKVYPVCTRKLQDSCRNPGGK